MGASNTSYVTARVRTKTVSLLPKDELTRMMEMSVPQILKTLQETAYKKEIEESAPLFRFSTADVIEHAVNLNLGRTYRSVFGYSRGSLKGGISAYIMYWDVWNLKTLLRGLNGSSPKEEILSDMVFGGSLPEAFWVRSFDDREHVADHFKGTPFQNIMRGSYGKEALSSVEDDLDRLYYDHLFGHAAHRPSARSDRIFLQFVRKEIDLRNLSTAVKIMFLCFNGGNEDMVCTMAKRGFVRNGWALNLTRFTELSGCSDMDEVLEKSSGLWYEEMLREIIEAGIGGSSRYYLRRIEGGLMDLATGYSVSYPLSILPVLSFLLRKRAEVENIRIIARAKSHGFSKEDIKELSWM
jgi:V/A-type H+-transporting ATPase subunit C